MYVGIGVYMYGCMHACIQYNTIQYNTIHNIQESTTLRELLDNISRIISQLPDTTTEKKRNSTSTPTQKPTQLKAVYESALAIVENVFGSEGKGDGNVDGDDE
jgi:hypothetical protein